MKENQIVVLEVYRITLLSNEPFNPRSDEGVLEVYRITLLSNFRLISLTIFDSFRGLQNYTTLKRTI